MNTKQDGRAGARGVLLALAFGVGAGLGVAAPGAVRLAFGDRPAHAQARAQTPARAGEVQPLASRPGGSPGRYALTVTPATYSDTGLLEGRKEYLLDTQTGQVWRLAEPSGGYPTWYNLGSPSNPAGRGK